MNIRESSTGDYQTATPTLAPDAALLALLKRAQLGSQVDTVTLTGPTADVTFRVLAGGDNPSIAHNGQRQVQRLLMQLRGAPLPAGVGQVLFRGIYPVNGQPVQIVKVTYPVATIPATDWATLPLADVLAKGEGVTYHPAFRP